MNKTPHTPLLLLLLSCFIFVCHPAFAQNKFKVTLDAGHGDHDYGAVYNGHIEKNITLAIVLKVGKILEARSDMQVNYTRKTDVFIELVERSNIANRADANIFVSIHCNANKNSAAAGTETYVMGLNKNASNLAVAKSENSVITLEKDYKQKYQGFDPNNPGSMLGITLMQEEYLENSIALASKLEDKFVLELSTKSRGVKQAPFMVLHKAYMPRVLIETGFISNPTDGARLDSEEGQEDIARAIANAIVEFKKEYFGSGDESVNVEKPSQKAAESTQTATDTPTTQVAPKAEPTKEEPKKTDKKAAEFKIQIAAVTKKVEPISANFNGLSPIEMIADGNVFKYSFGTTGDYAEAKRNLQQAKDKGFTSAYIVALKNGKKVSIQEALKK
ncbi:MAG: N-acetylmuramoyl-L-alanine amidase [Flavobacterium sp.]|nr:N-acetylmuramoyl-L-alanine amidase [Flavobacterium sp.]